MMRRTLADWSRGQWVLRGCVALLPVAAMLASAPELPRTWVLLLVLLLGSRWALAPESAVGVVAHAIVLAWWGIWVAEPLGPRLVLAAAGLTGAHVAAVVAAYGPGRMRVDTAVAWLWLRRCLALTASAPLVLLGLRAVDGQAPPAWMWASGALAVVAVAFVGALAIRAPEAR